MDMGCVDASLVLSILGPFVEIYWLAVQGIGSKAAFSDSFPFQFAQVLCSCVKLFRGKLTKLHPCQTRNIIQ